MEPTPHHVEPNLLPGEIGSLMGIPPALSGKLTAFKNFVAEIAPNFQSRPPQREGPEGARVGARRGLAAPSLAVEATADYDTQGADLVPPKVKAPGEVVPRGLAAPVRSFGGSSRGRHYYDTQTAGRFQGSVITL
jgi:hypothetical protein